jgi:hypothetical protein
VHAANLGRLADLGNDPFGPLALGHRLRRLLSRHAGRTDRGAPPNRWDRLQVVKTSQVLSLVQASILFALTALDQMNIWLLVTLTAGQGVIVAFNQPARLALVPSRSSRRPTLPRQWRSIR